jgi:nitrogen regulatory protein PII
MRPVKKLEIIVDALEVNTVTGMLDSAGVSGYTIIRDATGKGGRGLQRGDELTNVFSNAVIITACSAEEAAKISTLLRPLLHRVGGVCLLSDAVWLEH